MTLFAVRAEGVGKQYTIGEAWVRHNTLRDRLAGAAGRLAKRIRSGLTVGRPAGRKRRFWALRDVSFELPRGEVLGIIGPNGAGKSTLLKLLSRITEPTTGEIAVRGRVGSLLEVGTGFHSELTGRENIYLNGAILGMTKREIARKFDEIVAFSEVGRFIDTPVKHYSSGMYLRLGFAVAAHLEPEILLVDEVLAVGDAAFQKKCLGKMGQVAREGRTVIFVSHNLDAVQRLCTRCMLLEEGEVTESGAVAPVLARYMARGNLNPPPNKWIQLPDTPRASPRSVRFVAARYHGEAPAREGRPHPFAPIRFELKIYSDTARVVRSLAVYLRTPTGVKLVNADTVSTGTAIRLDPGETTVRLRLDQLLLNPGTYSVGLWLAETGAGAPLDHVESAFDLQVHADPAAGLGTTPGDNGFVATRFRVEQEDGGIGAPEADESS